jgi:hypothetical protein
LCPRGTNAANWQEDHDGKSLALSIFEDGKCAHPARSSWRRTRRGAADIAKLPDFLSKKWCTLAPILLTEWAYAPSRRRWCFRFCFPIPQLAWRKGAALPSLTPVDTMGATDGKASRCWCAESGWKVKAREQRDAYVIGMESASNSAAQRP